MSRQFPASPLWRQALALSLAMPARSNKRPLAHKLIEVIKQAQQGGRHGG